MNEAGNSTTSTAAKLMNPIHHMDPYLSTIHIGFPLIGIPINLLLAGTIIFTRQLQANQNIAWLGCGFANVFYLSGFLVEVAAAGNNSSVFLPLFKSIYGLPQACLVLYLHLSILDRYLFFRHTSFYKKYADRARIMAIQIICFVLVCLLIKGCFFYESLTRSLPLTLTEKEISIVITSVFMGAILLYVPCKQLQETYIQRKLKFRGKKSVPKNNSNSIETKVATAHLKKDSDDSENNQDNKASNSVPVTSRFEQYDDLESIVIHDDKANNQDLENNQEKLLRKTNIDNKLIDSSSSLESIFASRLEKSGEGRHANNLQDKATCTNLDENNEVKFSQSELQSYHGIKTNIKVFFVFSIIEVIFFAFALSCLKFCVIDGFLFHSCSCWFQTTFYLRGIFNGFYTAMFNPLCFARNSHDFFKLEKRCNPIGGIARATSRITNWFSSPNIISSNTHTHLDAVANMV